jgi:hypothetical protein
MGRKWSGVWQHDVDAEEYRCFYIALLMSSMGPLRF